MVNSFFLLTETKLILGITDSADDTLLNNFGTSANISLEDYIRSFYGDIPFETSEVTSDMNYAANYDVCMHYKLRNNNYEAAKEYQKLRDQTRESIKLSYQNNPQKQSSYGVIL